MKKTIRATPINLPLRQPSPGIRLKPEPEPIRRNNRAPHSSSVPKKKGEHSFRYFRKTRRFHKQAFTVRPLLVKLCLTILVNCDLIASLCRPSAPKRPDIPGNESLIDIERRGQSPLRYVLIANVQFMLRRIHHYRYIAPEFPIHRGATILYFGNYAPPQNRAELLF